jgi:hypothetical protein
MKKRRCTTCGHMVSHSNYDIHAGMCCDCVEVFTSVNDDSIRVPARDVKVYRDMFPGSYLDRCTIDWLRQNY